MADRKILIIADIEGSSGCTQRQNAKLFGEGWPKACLEMTRDITAVAKALYEYGVERIRVQDFHRTGYNIIPSKLHPGVELQQGYKNGPALGMGNPKEFQGLMMIGMHAPSASGGFLAHTLTSRIERVTINGKLVSEAQLFASALAPLGIRPVFFSGCPVACSHTRRFLPGVDCFSIDKNTPEFLPDLWRKKLADAAVKSMNSEWPAPYNPQGPFQVALRMTGKKDATKRLAQNWGLCRKGRDILFEVPDMNTLFRELSRLAYFTPVTERLLPIGLPLYHMLGRVGLAWVKKKPPVLTKPGAKFTE